MTKVSTAKTLLLAVFALCCISADAQAVPALENMNSQAELDKAITTLDASLFDAYNRCDLEKVSSFFVDIDRFVLISIIDRFAVISINVEFYHDQGGVTLGKAAPRQDVPPEPAPEIGCPICAPYFIFCPHLNAKVLSFERTRSGATSAY